MVTGKAILLAAALMLAAGTASAGPLQLVPKTAPDRYSADQAFFAIVLTPQTFCRNIGHPYVVAGPGCGGMIVHDHFEGPNTPKAFIGRNGGNFIGIPDTWWQAVESHRISAGYLQIVIAHEEGHLICGHPGTPDTRERELVADRLAGAAMRLIWANEHRTREQVATMVAEAYGDLSEDEHHPAWEVRMNAFIDGFIDPASATCDWSTVL